MDIRLIGAIKSAEEDAERRRRKAEEDGDDDKYFDVSHAYDAEFQGEEVSNPVKGLSQFPDVMIPLQRPQMEQRLRVRIEQANIAHWGPLDGTGPINPLKLRPPTKAEAKALKLSGDAAIWAREAAHLRAYLAQLDAKAEAEAKEARERRRNYLQRRATIDEGERAPWLKVIEDNKKAAERHEQRMKDEETYKLVVEARNELAALEHRAELAKRELDTLRPQ